MVEVLVSVLPTALMRHEANEAPSGGTLSPLPGRAASCGISARSEAPHSSAAESAARRESLAEASAADRAREAELDAAAAAALRPGRVRPLMAIAAESIVATSLDSLTAEVLASIPEPMAFLIFALVIKKRRLNYTLALAFRDCGHEAVRAEIAKMDLYAGLLPTFQSSCRP